MGEYSQEYSPVFKAARIAKKISRMINTIASIWGEDILGYLSLEITCSLKLTVFLELCSWKTVCYWEQVMSTDKHPSKWRLLFIYWTAYKILRYSNPPLLHAKFAV